MIEILPHLSINCNSDIPPNSCFCKLTGEGIHGIEVSLLFLTGRFFFRSCLNPILLSSFFVQRY